MSGTVCGYAERVVDVKPLLWPCGMGLSASKLSERLSSEAVE